MRGRLDVDGVLSVVEPAFRVPLDLSYRDYANRVIAWFDQHLKTRE